MTEFLKATDAIGEAVDSVTARITKGVGKRLEWVTVNVDIDCNMVAIEAGIKLKETKYTPEATNKEEYRYYKDHKKLVWNSYYDVKPCKKLRALVTEILGCEVFDDS